MTYIVLKALLNSNQPTNRAMLLCDKITRLNCRCDIGLTDTQSSADKQTRHSIRLGTL